MTSFVAIDLETANKDRASICQVGIARFENGVVIEEYKTLVNPKAEFIFTHIHGITAEDVENSPTFEDVYPKIQEFLQDAITVHHHTFDRDALNDACAVHHLPPLKTTWLDNAVVARATWVQFSYKGWNLKNLCNHIGHEFTHHDALEDAKACGAVLLACLEENGDSLEDWVDAINSPPSPRVVKEKEFEPSAADTSLGCVSLLLMLAAGTVVLFMLF